MNRKRLLAAALVCTSIQPLPWLFANPPQSILVLTSAEGDDPAFLGDYPTENETTASDELRATSDSAETLRTATTGDQELIRERFKNGRVRIERHVAMDDESNFVNDGSYQEWNEAGDLIAFGSYSMGKKQGAWVRICTEKESKLFGNYPYNKFKGPYHSTAEFADDAMNGIWTITDADNRIISQVQLQDGLREGQATWYHPSGSIHLQAEFKGGLLDGRFLEQSTAGKTVREDRFIAGQKVTAEREFFPNKKLKSDYQVLTATQRLISKDDFDKSMLADFEAEAKSIRDGVFVLYHENGEVRTKGRYEQNQLTGAFECWYDNGQKEVAGAYENGLQTGRWTWWHANGMRRASGSYQAGEQVGEFLAWNEKGKRVSGSASGMTSKDIEDRKVPVKTESLLEPWR